ncbi:MAG: RNA polymerase sigma-70 factor [Rhodothermales bacterium]|nr:RNA polymerase sigma-70 factor [Rhodothermales bacterium]
MDSPTRPGPTARTPPQDQRRVQFRQWARGLRDADRAAYAALYREMSDPLVRYAYSILHDEAGAYDILQDVFLKLWERRASIDPESSLQALLYTMTRNACLNVRRRNGYVVQEADDESGPLARLESVELAAGQAIDANALQQRMDAWIQELPDRRREAFLLSRQHDLSHRDISDLMGLSERTVNTHIFLALKDLRARLTAWQNEKRTP